MVGADKMGVGVCWTAQGASGVNVAVDATESAVSPTCPRIRVALSAVARSASILISPRAQREKC